MKAQAGVDAHRVGRSSDPTGHKLDAVGAYPHGQIVFNICRASTAKEVIGIDGCDSYTLKMQGINLVTAGHTNAIEFCTTMLNAPSLNELLMAFNVHRGVPNPPHLMAIPRQRPMLSIREVEEEDEDDESASDPYKLLDAAVEGVTTEEEAF